MSSPPREQRPITLLKLAEKRALGEPIVMVTAYDHPSATIVDDAGVDVVLVGDTAANNVLGYRDTVPITMDELLMLARAVRRGLKTPLMVGDLPFGTYEASDEQAIATAHRDSSKRRAVTPSNSKAAARWPSAHAPSSRPTRR